MKIKLAQLVNAVNAGSVTRLTEMSMPIKTSFKLRQIVKQINQQYTEYDTSRVELLKRCGAVKDDSENVWKFPNADIEAKVNAEHSELTSLDIELQGEPFKVKDFLSSAAISVQDLFLLDWLILDDTEAVEKPAEIQPDLAFEAEA